MKSYMAKSQTVEREWYIVDAEGVSLGRLASQVASVLRGKNKPTFTPNVDCGARAEENHGKRGKRRIFYVYAVLQVAFICFRAACS